MDALTETLIKDVITNLEGYPDNFSWTPSFSINPLSKIQLINELKNCSKIGLQYLRIIHHGTLVRIRREITRRG